MQKSARQRGAVWAALCAISFSAVVFSRGLVAQQAANPLPPLHAMRAIVRGTVVSRADTSEIFAAEIRTLGGAVLGRTNQHGQFAISAASGDTLVVRALGFRERRVAVSDIGMRVALEVSPTVLSTYTTTVGQREIRGTEATVNTTVLDRSDIDGVAAISANQLLRQIPGLQEVASPPSQTTIAIRGFDASRVLVLIDGEPVSGGLIENRDIGRLSTVATERIEVTKGPSGVEFGSDALGGVINLVSAAPTKPFSVDGVVRQGELGRMEGTLGASQTVGTFGYRINGGWRQLDRVLGIDAIGSTFERVFDLRTSFRYRVSDRLSLRADVQGSTERQRWPVGGGYNGFIDNQTGQGFVEVQLQALGGAFRARTFAQRDNYQFRQSQLSVPIAGSGNALEQHERINRVLLAYSRSAGRQTVDLGGQFTTRQLVAPTKVIGDSAEDQVTEVFAKDSWTLGPTLSTVGARYTSSTLWGDAFNPSFGLAWQAAQSWRFRGNVARGFRAPSFKEIRYTFANPAAGYTVVGNGDLRPESSWSTTVGGTFAPNGNVSFDVEGYRNNVKDLIDTRYGGVNASGLIMYSNVNVARAHTAGVETSVRVMHGPYDATFGYDYLHTRDDELRLPLSQRAAHTARAHVQRAWNVFSGIITDANVRYTGSSKLIGSVGDSTGVVGHQGDFLAIDAQLRVSLSHLAELSGGVNNLLDNRPVLYTPAYARQLFLALHLKWSAPR
ncbi:MAG: TonB-dependent receptor [Gemmatimonadaceae bacterium]